MCFVIRKVPLKFVGRNVYLLESWILPQCARNWQLLMSVTYQRI